jgi:hypothetical protein
MKDFPGQGVPHGNMPETGGGDVPPAKVSLPPSEGRDRPLRPRPPARRPGSAEGHEHLTERPVNVRHSVRTGRRGRVNPLVAERLGRRLGVRKPRRPDERDSEGPRGQFVQAEAVATIRDTFKAIIEHVVQLVAEAHGLGLLLRAVKLTIVIGEWIEVGEGRRGLDIDMPIPLSYGVDLDLSAHVGQSSGSDEPPITVCFAPISEPEPGVLVVDGLRVSPGDDGSEEQADSDSSMVLDAQETLASRTPAWSAENHSQVVLVNLDLWQLMSGIPDPCVRSQLLYFAGRQLPSELKGQQVWNDLRTAGLECIVFYDERAKCSIWLLLDAIEYRTIPARITLDGAGMLMPWGYP